MSAEEHLSESQFKAVKEVNGYKLNENNECINCDYFKKQHEAETGRPVGEYEEYPGWDSDWAHTHR